MRRWTPILVAVLLAACTTPPHVNQPGTMTSTTTIERTTAAPAVPPPTIIIAGGADAAGTWMPLIQKLLQPPTSRPAGPAASESIKQVVVVTQPENPAAPAQLTTDGPEKVTATLPGSYTPTGPPPPTPVQVDNGVLFKIGIAMIVIGILGAAVRLAFSSSFGALIPISPFVLVGGCGAIICLYAKMLDSEPWWWTAILFVIVGVVTVAIGVHDNWFKLKLPSAKSIVAGAKTVVQDVETAIRPPAASPVTVAVNPLPASTSTTQAV